MERIAGLSQPAILTAILSALAHELPQAGRPLRGWMALQEQAGFGLQNSNQIARVDVGLIFATFIRGEMTFVASFGEIFDSRLRHRVGSQVHQSASTFGSEATGKWIKQSFQNTGRIAFVHTSNCNVICPDCELQISYPATMLTSFLGTMTTFLMFLPSRKGLIFSQASAACWISSCDASAGTVTRSRSLPLT